MICLAGQTRLSNEVLLLRLYRASLLRFSSVLQLRGDDCALKFTSSLKNRIVSVALASKSIITFRC